MIVSGQMNLEGLSLGAFVKHDGKNMIVFRSDEFRGIVSRSICKT